MGEVAAGNNISSNGSVATVEKKMPQFTKCYHEALVEIFKKIGQKELTRGCLISSASSRGTRMWTSILPGPVQPVLQVRPTSLNKYDL